MYTTRRPGLAAQAVRERAAAHARHHHVGEQQIGLGAPLLDGREGRARIVDDGRVEAEAAHEAGGEARERRVVLHDEDALAPRGRRPGARGRPTRRLRGHARQADRERRSPAGRGGDVHAAAALAHDAVDGREAEPRALADGLRREERLEDAGDRRLVHAGARVRHAQHGVVAGGEHAVGQRLVGLEARLADGELDRSAAGHRVARVHDEVHDHLLDLPGIGADRDRLGRRRHGERDVLADQATQHLLEVPREIADVDDLRPEHLLPAEREELAREGRRAVDARLDLAEVLARGIVLGQIEAHELAGGLLRLQEVVEVVRDAAREPADRLHALRLVQLRAQHLLLGLRRVTLAHVAHEDERAVRALEVDRLARRLDRDLLAAGAEDRHLQRLALGGARRGDARDAIAEAGAIARGDAALERLADEIARRAHGEEAARGGVRVREAPVDQHDDRVGRAVDDAAEALLAAPERLVARLEAVDHRAQGARVPRDEAPEQGRRDRDEEQALDRARAREEGRVGRDGGEHAVGEQDPGGAERGVLRDDARGP
jgi:hypothetical protein